MKTSVKKIAKTASVDKDHICCGQSMDAVGFIDCNGWICKKCGHKDYDIASIKSDYK